MKFKIGDRVAAYDGNVRYIATVRSISDIGFLSLTTKDSGYMCFHPKQCRLLKKKTRRSIWIPHQWLERGHLFQVVTSYGAVSLSSLMHKPDPGLTGIQACTEFREVLKK